jgi:hypothetical protein
MSVEFTQLVVGAADRKDDAIDALLIRRMNGVGQWETTLHNQAGVYNGVFNVQDQFQLDLDAVTLMQGRLDGPGQRLIGQDIEDIWGEFTTVGGFDQAQDLLFHNDFEKLYPDFTQSLHSVVNDVFNVELAGLTNITYVPPAASPVIGGAVVLSSRKALASLEHYKRCTAERDGCSSFKTTSHSDMVRRDFLHRVKPFNPLQVGLITTFLVLKQ